MNERFDLLPENARIWIYQSDRKLNESEADSITKKSENFVTSWAAHGNALESGAKIYNNYFLVLAVNEDINKASGCSIDASVSFIRAIENEFSINLLDRSKIAFIHHEEVMVIDFKEIKNKIEEGIISGETLIFNNLVETKQEIESNWKIPAKDSWLKKYFK